MFNILPIDIEFMMSFFLLHNNNSNKLIFNNTYTKFNSKLDKICAPSLFIDSQIS